MEDNDDEQTLITVENHSNVTEDEISNLSFAEQQQPQNYNARAYHPILTQEQPPLWQLLVFGIFLIIFSTCLVVCLPVYLHAVNKTGDVYSALLFVSIFSYIPLVIYIQVKYSYFCQFLRLGPPLPLSIMKIGVFHGLSGLLVFYSLDRKRVVCHAQEPLLGLVLMFMIIIYFFYKGPELSSAKMFSLCGILGGVFLSMDFQLNNMYMCHGKTRYKPEDDGGVWSSQAHALWTIVYAIAIFFFTLSWLLLEKEIFSKKSGLSSESLLNTVSGGVSNQILDTEALIDSAFSYVNISHTTISSKWGMHLVWYGLGSLFTVVSLFWTDFFTALGKGGSPKGFIELTSGGLNCHFHYNDECGPTAIYGWIFTISYLGWLYFLGKVLSHSSSFIYTLAVTSVALPLSALWWALFRTEDVMGMEWHPQITGELIFSLLGLPIIIICLVYWSIVDHSQKLRSNNFPLTTATTI